MISLLCLAHALGDLTNLTPWIFTRPLNIFSRPNSTLMVSCNMNRIYYVGYRGSELRSAQTYNNNTHIHRRELSVISRTQLAWEEDEMMIRLYTAAAEQRCRSIQWDIGEHNVYREILGLVLEIVNKAMERSEENKVNKNFVGDDSDED